MGIRIAVVEDDPFTRLTLAESLRGQGLDVVLVTDSATEALREVPARGVHAVFLDLHLGAGPTGIDLALALRRERPRLGIVLLTTFDDPRLLSPTLPEPPQGTRYVTKRSLSSVEELLGVLRDAVNAAAPGGSPTAAGSSTQGTRSEVSGLSDIQIETLRLVAQGLSNAEIARRRDVTERAIEATIGRLTKLLGVAPDAALNQRVHLAQVYFRSLGLSVEEP